MSDTQFLYGLGSPARSENERSQCAAPEPAIAPRRPAIRSRVGRAALSAVGRAAAAHWFRYATAPRPPKPGSNAAFRNSAEDFDRDRLLAAVLITDIVDSTKLAARMGDRRWLTLLEKHDAITRRQIKLFGGKEVRNCGDGFLATFDSSTRAIRCAASIAELVDSFGIALRSGVHAGEIHLKRGEISGIAVHLAARIASMAQAGESLVSKTARDLAIGSEIAFEDRGMHLLRGAAEKTHLYAVRAGFRANAPNRGSFRLDPDPGLSQSASIRQFA